LHQAAFSYNLFDGCLGCLSFRLVEREIREDFAALRKLMKSYLLFHNNANC
jgi:hypothetical protein